eukprot:maker-scaffold105_size367834-snap-gene-2.31 protein:Tk10190 transcript:maker-scaffold105_size367834-snap-gene-2.31-mRNA-1 annotation:"ankyrin repeat protein"
MTCLLRSTKCKVSGDPFKGKMPKKTWQKLMWNAVSQNEIGEIQRLIHEHKVTDELRTLRIWRNEEAPIHLAAYCGYNDILTLFLDHGVDVDSYNVYSDGYKVTCLHFAIYRNKVSTVKLLMERGADPSLVGVWGSTRGSAIDFARQRGLRSLIPTLKQEAKSDEEPDSPEPVRKLDEASKVKIAELQAKRIALESELKRVEKDLANLTRCAKVPDYNLECSVCLNVPKNKILTCRNCDVLMCNACQGQVEICPGCRSSFTDESPHRNRWAEKLPCDGQKTIKAHAIGEADPQAGEIGAGAQPAIGFIRERLTVQHE